LICGCIPQTAANDMGYDVAIEIAKKTEGSGEIGESGTIINNEVQEVPVIEKIVEKKNSFDIAQMYSKGKNWFKKIIKRPEDQKNQDKKDEERKNSLKKDEERKQLIYIAFFSILLGLIVLLIVIVIVYFKIMKKPNITQIIFPENNE
jgi:hypothetical protein